MIERIKLKEKEIVLVGTAHISRDSILLVDKTIREENPDIIGVELDRERLHQLLSEKKWQEMDIVQVIKEGKTYLLLFNLLLANIQRQFGEQVGIKPGEEMKAALHAASELNVPVQLLDRDVKITLKRAMHEMSLFEKMKLIGSIFLALFSSSGEKLTAEKVEELKQKDMINKLLQELSKQMPSVKKVLVDERDIFIANRILQAHGKKIVAIVGAGHLDGIKKYLDKPRNISSLNSLPKEKNYFKLLKYVIPLLFAVIVFAAFYFKGITATLNVFFIWFMITGLFSALGALFAKAHWKSIAVAFLAAPFTTIHPALAAGWFAGLAEAKMRAPRVKDFESLTRLSSFSDFNKNAVTHILLVTAYCNIGATIGVIIAVPYMLSLLA